MPALLVSGVCGLSELLLMIVDSLIRLIDLPGADRPPVALPLPLVPLPSPAFIRRLVKLVWLRIDPFGHFRINVLANVIRIHLYDVFALQLE